MKYDREKIYVCPECDIVWDADGDLGTDWPGKGLLERKLCKDCDFEKRNSLGEKTMINQKQHDFIKRIRDLVADGKSANEATKILIKEGFTNQHGEALNPSAVGYHMTKIRKENQPKQVTKKAKSKTKPTNEKANSLFDENDYIDLKDRITGLEDLVERHLKIADLRKRVAEIEDGVEEKHREELRIHEHINTARGIKIAIDKIRDLAA